MSILSFIPTSRRSHTASHVQRVREGSAWSVRCLMGTLFICSLGLNLNSTQAESPQTVQVRLKESKLRSQPKFWAAAVADLNYGDSLTIVGNEASWLKVKTRGGKQGFIHPSVVTEKKVVLASSANVQANADPSDVVLAGKGFSREVEHEYAKKNPAANYREVDQMEHQQVGDQELLAFIRDGKLGNGAL